MQERFLAYNIKKKLLNKEDLILCAVSGGVDSMVMVDLLLKGSYNIGIAHVNHKKRGEASEEDAVFIKNYSKSKGIPYFEMELKKPNAKVNFQEYAREERYKWFEKLSFEHKYNKIVTAHHLDDVVETFFINAMRGSGSGGLSSIKESRGKIARPLLSFTKSEISEYASKNHIQYREDSSNAQNDYLRNRIRNQLLPLAIEIDGKSMAGFYKSVNLISDENDLLRELIQQNKKSWIKKNKDNATIDIEEINKYKGRLSLLHHLLSEYGFTLDQLESLLNNPKTGSKFFTPNYVGFFDRGKLTISNSDINNNFLQLEISEAGEYGYGDYKLKIEEVGSVDFANNNERCQYLGFKNPPWPLLVRSWKIGDKFKPFGLGGQSQTLKKFFVNEKISLLEKSKIPLIVKNNTICCVVSKRISEEYRVKDDSDYILKVSWEAVILQ
jgi:tRNA(Ile)-lysidine synthase